MLLEIISFFTGRKIVYLEDFEGEVYKTIEERNPFGTRTAYIFPFVRVGCRTLNDDGTVSNSYIKRWKYAKK